MGKKNATFSTAVPVSFADKTQKQERAGCVFLLLLCALLSVMILLGGLTRLTDSGLSITDWSPIMGAIPPLSTQEWQNIFSNYQQTYEFRYQNSTMTLDAFKIIFWWEWGHRQLGRLIGLVWAFGFIWLWWRSLLLAGWARRFFILGGLGGLQGFIGWWMVASGLKDEMLDVAAYRLAVHLCLAFFILGLMFWYYQLLSRGGVDILQSRRLRNVQQVRMSFILVGLIFTQIFIGALVAGLDAGSGYRDWPLMAGQFFPDAALSHSPLLVNFFENPAFVQFNHRILAYILIIFAVYHVWRARKMAYKNFLWANILFTCALIGQAVLGVITLAYGGMLEWGILHQAGGIILWIFVLRVSFLATYPQNISLTHK